MLLYFLFIAGAGFVLLGLAEIVLMFAQRKDCVREVDQLLMRLFGGDTEVQS